MNMEKPCSTTEATRGHHARVHAVLGCSRLADPGTTTEPRGLTETQSRPADIFTTAVVSQHNAALHVCVASSNAVAAGGDAEPCTTGGKYQTYDHVYRPLVWAADGRPHPVTRTLQYAADIASCRNGQQMSAKAQMET